MSAFVLRLVAAAAAVVTASLAPPIMASPAMPESPPPVGQVRIAGAPQTVFSWARQACEPAEAPDLPVRAFRDYRGRVQLLLSHYANFRLIGRSLTALRRDCRPVMRSHDNAAPGGFEDREWLASLFTSDGRTIWALVHDEYQGNQHPGRCPSGSYDQCWYNSVTIVRSRNGGRSYSHLPLGPGVVAAPAEPYQGAGGPLGVFAPSNIVTGPDGAYYALVRVREPDGAHGDCLLRTTRVGSPGAWRAWDGHGFDVSFPDPYLAPARPSSGCALISIGNIAEMTESLTYNRTLGRYLLVGLAPPGPLSLGAQLIGIYFSTSRDLIHWSPRTLVAPAVTAARYNCGGPSPIAYPSVVDPTSRSRTYSTSASHPYLYFTQFHYEACHQTPDRDLERVSLEISR